MFKFCHFCVTIYSSFNFCELHLFAFTACLLKPLVSKQVVNWTTHSKRFFHARNAAFCWVNTKRQLSDRNDSCFAITIEKSRCHVEEGVGFLHKLFVGTAWLVFAVKCVTKLLPALCADVILLFFFRLLSNFFRYFCIFCFKKAFYKRNLFKYYVIMSSAVLSFFMRN